MSEMTNKIEEDELISLFEFKQFLYDHIVPVDDIADYTGNPITKILPYWRKHQLLPFIETGKHFKISFAQLIWIKILDSLRQLGYSIKDTEKVTEYFFADAYSDDLPKKNFQHNKDILMKSKKAGTLTKEGEWILMHIENFLKQPGTLDVLKWDINYLTVLLTNCIDSGEEKAILIYPEGKVGELHDPFDEPHTHRDYKLSRLDPHIHLSLTYYLMDFIEKDELSNLFLPQLLNDDEKQVLKAIRNKNIKEIKIEMKGGKPIKIESSSSGLITGQQAQEIKKTLGLKNYERITLDTVDEKTLSFKKTKKK